VGHSAHGGWSGGFFHISAHLLRINTFTVAYRGAKLVSRQLCLEPLESSLFSVLVVDEKGGVACSIGGGPRYWIFYEKYHFGIPL